MLDPTDRSIFLVSMLSVETKISFPVRGSLCKRLSRVTQFFLSLLSARPRGQDQLDLSLELPLNLNLMRHTEVSCEENAQRMKHYKVCMVGRLL